MSEMDRKILEAIKTETDATSKDYERDLGLFGLIAESFKGAMRWAVVGAMAMQVVLGAAFIYCALRLFDTDDTGPKSSGSPSVWLRSSHLVCCESGSSWRSTGYRLAARSSGSSSRWQL
jgi:hypothetical protein